MTDKSEQFREIPAIRGMLADPMKTSREINDIKDRLKQGPDYSQLSQSLDDKLRISNDNFSNMLSGAIINNQRDYQDLSGNIENLEDTYKDIGFEMQWRMEDQIDEMRGVKREMRIKNNIARKRVEQSEEANEHLDSIDQGIQETNRGIDQTNRGISRTTSAVESMHSSMSHGFSQISGGLSSVKGAVDNLTWVNTVQYGANIRSEHEHGLINIMKQHGWLMKKSAMSLFSKGYLHNVSVRTMCYLNDENKSHDLVEKFIGKEISSQEVRDIQKWYIQNMNELQNMRDIVEEGRLEEARLDEQRDGVYKCYNIEIDNLEKQYGLQGLGTRDRLQKIQSLPQEYHEQQAIIRQKKEIFLTHKEEARKKIELKKEIQVIEKVLELTDEEIDLIDVYWEAKSAENIRDLINKGLVDNESLDILSKNMFLSGAGSQELIQEMTIDENGVNPTYEHEGDVGRLQELRALRKQGNFALRQRQGIWEGILQGNELTTITNDILLEVKNELSEGNELTRITNDILLEVKNGLSDALYSIGDVLHNIGDTLIQGFNEISEELQSIRQVNQNIFEELQLHTLLLEDIKKTLLNPLDTKANEFYKQGVYRTEIKNRNNAFNNFKKGLDEKDNHLGNLYGAGTVSMLLGKHKEAAKYLLRAYQVAKKEAKQKITSQIALDIAKINTKYLRLKLAKKRLNESITNDKGNIEAFLLKARITKILGQEKEFEDLIQIIYNELISGGNDTNIPMSYMDIFRYFHKSIDIVTKEEISAGGTSKLIKILPNVHKIGYTNGMKTILGEILTKNPMALKKAGIHTEEMLQKDKDFFNKKYKEMALKNYTGGKSTDLFALAYIGYQFIDFTTIKQIIKTGLDFDIDYINLKNERDIQKKKIYLKNIKDKIYALGDTAKYMLRDYLATNPSSLLNI